MAITISGSGITSANIADGTIVNADINSSAAIDGNKLTGAGKVLQVVQGTYSTSVTSSTSTLIDTGLTATITPSSATSKILCIFHQNGVVVNNNTDVHLTLLRSGVTIHRPSRWDFYTASTLQQRGQISSTYLDSPAATTALVYKSMFASGENVADTRVQYNGSDTVSTITLMEIAQ